MGGVVLTSGSEVSSGAVHDQTGVVQFDYLLHLRGGGAEKKREKERGGIPVSIEDGTRMII